MPCERWHLRVASSHCSPLVVRQRCQKAPGAWATVKPLCHVDAGRTGRSPSFVAHIGGPDWIRTSRRSDMNTSIRRDHCGSALRGFADGDAPGPEGIPRARGRPRDVPERHRVLACGASTGCRRPRTVGTARSADGDRMSADSHVRVRFRPLHALRVAGHGRRARRVLRQADGARQIARRRSG